MAEEQANVNPPASSGGITQAQLNAAVASAMGPLHEQVKSLQGELAQARKDQKILADTLAAQKPADPEALKSLVGQTIGQTLAEERARDAKAAAVAKAKGDWLEKNAPKLPATYRKLIPDTEDEAELAKAGQAAIDRYKAENPSAGASAATATTAGSPPVVTPPAGGGFLKMPGAA